MKSIISKAIVYRFTDGYDMPANLSDMLAENAFRECGASQAVNRGWKVYNDKAFEDNFAIEVMGVELLSYYKEEKSVPSAILKSELEKRLDQIEESTGDRPRGKEKVALKSEVVLNLLPRCFAKPTSIPVMIHRPAGLLIIGTSSYKAAEEVSSYLRSTIGSLPIAMLELNTHVQILLDGWLKQTTDLPKNLYLGNNCAMIDESGEVKQTATFGGSDLTVQEIQDCIVDMHTKKLALYLSDVGSFTVNNEVAFEKLSYAVDETDEADYEDESQGMAAEIQSNMLLESAAIANIVDVITKA